MSISILSKHADKSYREIYTSSHLSGLFQKNLFCMILILSCLFFAGCSAESAPARWQQTETGVYQRYQALLDCESMPDTGAFQNCNVMFTTASGEMADLQLTLVEGGMPTHGHGLPTSPILRPLDKPGTYRIDGLKYNMPGAWLLGFRISGAAGEDQIVFDFVI